jgi:hypothetical protein
VLHQEPVEVFGGLTENRVRITEQAAGSEAGHLAHKVPGAWLPYGVGVPWPARGRGPGRCSVEVLGVRGEPVEGGLVIADGVGAVFEGEFRGVAE